jgi:hypothetical protein
MAGLKLTNSGPIAVTASIANLLNPPTASGGVNCGSSAQYVVVRQVNIVNTGAATTFSFFKGATGGSAAGTEIWGSLTPIAANAFVSFPAAERVDSTQFITGKAGAATLTVDFAMEIGVAG